MYNRLHGKITYPAWANGGRYARLDGFDRLLDGTIYDHLTHSFYDEKASNNDIISIQDRRPSAQYRLCRMVSRWCSRKLFSGRHAPLIRSQDKSAAKKVRKVVKTVRFWKAMAEIVYLGSVGSVAATFRLDNKGRPSITAWRSKFCWPSLNEENELTNLRIAYTSKGSSLMAYDPGFTDLEPQAEYWFIRDYGPQFEVTWVPPKKSEWNPVEGFADKNQRYIPIPSLTFEHKLGFVPGHWFVNLPGGKYPDGACTWEDAIPISIELDYTLSQIGRGTRYNSAPQLVTIGSVMNQSDIDGIVRAPVSRIAMQGGYKDEGGNTIAAGDAKLLEMTGAGTEAALKLIDKLRNMALEIVSTSRKDPEKIKGTMSGRAMEFMDEDADDLIMELRSQYGEHGCLPFLRKILVAKRIEIGAKIDLQWPRLFQPTPDDLAKMIPALLMACGGGPQAKPSPGEPGTAAPPTVILLEPEQARRYLEANMDISMYEDADDTADDPDEGDPSDVGGPPPDPVGEDGGEKDGGSTIHPSIYIND